MEYSKNPGYNTVIVIWQPLRNLEDQFANIDLAIGHNAEENLDGEACEETDEAKIGAENFTKNTIPEKDQGQKLFQTWHFQVWTLWIIGIHWKDESKVSHRDIM